MKQYLVPMLQERQNLKKKPRKVIYWARHWKKTEQHFSITDELSKAGKFKGGLEEEIES